MSRSGPALALRVFGTALLVAACTDLGGSGRRLPLQFRVAPEREEAGFSAEAGAGMLFVRDRVLTGNCHRREVHRARLRRDTVMLRIEHPRHTTGAQKEQIYFWCDWTPRRPAGKRIVADVQFEAVGIQGRPRQQDLRRLRSAGARILHIFNVAMARVDIPIDSVPRLVKGPGRIAQQVATVPDVSNRDILVYIHYKPGPFQQDTDTLEALGIRASPGLHPLHLSATVPDSVIPKIRRLPRIWAVQPPRSACLEDF